MGSARALYQMQSLLRARPHRSLSMLEEGRRDLGAIDDGIAPTIEFDALGQHFGAHAASVTRDRVEDQLQTPTAHDRLTNLLLPVRPVAGSTRAARV